MSKALNHAYLLIGGEKETIARADEIALNLMGPSFPVSADYYFRDLETFSVDDARILSAEMSRSPISGDCRLFIIRARSITVPAQNALLKAIEEAATFITIILALTRRDNILNTLASRMLIEILPLREESFLKAQKFMDSSVGERSKLWSDFLVKKKKEDENENNHKKRLVGKNEALNEIILLTRFVENKLRQSNAKTIDYARNYSRLSSLFRARAYLAEPSSIVRLIMENLLYTL